MQFPCSLYVKLRSHAEASLISDYVKHCMVGDARRVGQQENERETGMSAERERERERERMRERERERERE